MAGISQKISREEVLPELAHSVYTLGYFRGQPKEFLLLLERYVRQARQLQALAGPDGEIRIEHCEDAGPLLQVLGYRLRNECGHKDAFVAALNPENAFLTIDSGFPLTQLEEALQNGTPFVYAYAPSRVPVLLKADDWTNIGTWRKPAKADFVDELLHDPQVARLYWAFSRMDPETTVTLRRSVGLSRLLPYAEVLDFYGSQLCIRSGKLLVPGGAAAESGWKDLVGASPESPGDFIVRLVGQNRGWLAAYFDTLARLNQSQQTHLTEGSRLVRLYEAFRDSSSNIEAAGASYRKAPALLVLFTRQQWLPDGEPRIPGNVDLWRHVLGKRARRLDSPEQVLEAMVSCSRMETDSGPLQIYLSLSSLDRERPPQRPVSSETLGLMASSYAQFSSWYSIFTEFPELNDGSISRFINVADSLDRISNQDLRGNALGTFQANLGLWQILARQGEIPKGQLDGSWQRVIAPFNKIGSSTQLFDAGDKSLGEIMLAATGKAGHSQDELIDLLAGPPQKNAQGRRVRAEMARKMRLVMEDQRLTSLDTLSELGQGLNAMAHGAERTDRLVALAGDLREFEMPRPIFSEGEKLDWAPEVAKQHHAELEMHADLKKVIDQSSSPAKLEAGRGQLAAFLRDTLVGLNYAYYEPAGSQILHINPLFVRSHDFAAVTVAGDEYVWQAPTLFGAGASAGGGAYLVGSLADLPYVLAAAEENFIAPQNVQALIWEQLVPNLLGSATLSRWWNISPQELHAVALYQQSGEELLTAAADNQELRAEVAAILSERVSPRRLQPVETARQPREMADAIAGLMPADLFYLAAEFPRRFPREQDFRGPSGRALDKLSQEDPAAVDLERISVDFGIPHPISAQTYGRRLHAGKPFPPFGGACNRLFGESWDSGNLYWARLADERNDPPETLNILSPQLTRLMISKIFATDVEDWSAVVRGMHEAGEDLMQGKVAFMPETSTTAQR
jgi:hypothetical protein